MAGTEGVGELYTGWSYVVHRPSDEPEPSDLPSTVDMAAFSSELNTTPADNAQAEESSDSDSDSDSDTNKSGSDESESSDQSDSSNSDSSSSSQDSNSRPPTPEFSVTSSQTNSLRLTISKACVSPTEKKPADAVVKTGPPKGAPSGSESDDSDSGKSDASKTGRKDVKECVRRQVRRLRARAPAETGPAKRAVVRKDVPVVVVGGNKGPAKKGKAKRNPKMASLPISRGSTYSSDSDNSDNETNMVNYDVLQEINQEDLAAILPDQQEIDSYVFDKNNSANAIPPKETFNDSTNIIEDGSGSDMELHQQAVNALIQRTTSESENESQDLPPNSLYSNSLLQQFEVQTQMLNTSAAAPNIDGVAIQNSVAENQNKDLEKDQTKRKRGRPRKTQKSSVKTEFSGDPNVSPDSGIQNSPDHVSSPEASPIPNKNKIIEKKTIKIPEKIVKNNLTTKLKEQNKLPVTCNKFDRLLYGNTDRVLYPPRRKAGRPPVAHKKGPGRPPKHKTNDTKNDEKSEVKSQKKKLLKTKTTPTANATICPPAEKTKDSKKPGKKPQKVISSKTKPELRLKYAKLMHSKHKHRKHKKCKFKILKPITTTPDPKITAEIEKLVQDFVKLCNITSKENVPEVIKALKKTSKKRKTSEYAERKKKKQTATAISKETSNEQRLPLKKRHYHLNAESKDETETNEDKNDKKLKENKLPLVEKKIEIPNLKTNTNNNEYEVDTHIDEAIEACITKYSKDGKVKPETSPKTSPKIEEKKEISVSAITTPKKRHLLEIANNLESLKAAKTNLLDTLKSDELKKNKSLENVVTEIKLKRLSPKISEAQMITRKKNRLEDLTSTLVSKISPTAEENKRKLKEETSSRASVIKYPVCKKAKPAENEKLDSVVEEKPTGIFTPTVDLEIHLPNDIKTEHPVIKIETKEPIAEAKKESSKRKIRKRRAINRTGFPTVKKKKKKIVETPEIEKPIICDRVPKEGEEYSSFVQRSQSQLAVTPLEKLEEDNVMKWESISECDSLPQDERIEFDLEVRSDKKRDISPSSSVGTRSSGTLKKRREYTPDCPTDDDMILEARLKRVGRKRGLRELHRKAKDKRLRGQTRDVSPASSIEPSVEKRLREERASASGDDKKNKKAPRWRKKHLVAGLFSDYYKEDDETARQKRAEAATTKARLVYNPADHPFGLLPAPYHCGKYLRCRKIPFQLPHDLWWQHTHSQLPGRDIVPSWNYRKIRTNVYNVKLTTGACEPQSCNCKDSNCGDDCINRLVLAECPTTHKCHNQKIQKHEWAPGLEKFMTDSKGWGVRTNLPIKSGEFILEYVGEVVSDQEFKERMASRYAHDTHHYCLHLDGGLVIDGHRMGGDGRFVNHSCSPNCEMQKWSVNGQFRMALFSLRGIDSGEELTYDYNFSLFNPADGQECKCGSDVCRGVIGGKSQRVKRAELEKPGNVGGNATGNGSSGNGNGVGGGGRVGRPRKNQAKKAPPACPKENGAHAGPLPVAAQQQTPLPALRPLSNAQRAYVQEHRVFLLRNLYKARRSKGGAPAPAPVSRAQTATPTDQTTTNASAANSSSTTFVNHINALRQPRNMKTRRLAQAEDDPELQKTAKLATFLQDLYNIITKTKDEKDEQLCAPFITLPTKRKQPNYYQKIADPIDLNMIEQNIASGIYKTAESFDLDMSRLFANAIKFYGRTSELGIAATRLKKIYVEAKQQNVNKFFDEIGEKPPSNFLVGKNKGEEEDVIRCICGMFRDEGLMIQCERCLVWQHCECVRADEEAPSYHCERCVPRNVDFEISMDEFTEHGHRYYMTLLRGDLQLRQGDTVYVLRDIPIPGTNKKHTYDTIGTIKYSDLDIFRIERLWKDSKTGQRFAYGHHYLRPHETYHEPTRKFFPNEVMRVPLYEAVPVELIMEHCWVMDLNTYCKGRPMGAPPEHIYICEYRVDKTARLFSKVSKSKFPMCTKSYAFERFDTRLKISRTYTPHDLDTVPVKPRGRKPQEVEEEGLPQQPAARQRGDVQQVAVQIPVVKTRAEKQTRLNKILLNLLGKLSTKQPLDVSYLLEGGRRRKKTT